MKHVLGIDVGGSAIKYALMQKDGTLLEKDSVCTPLDSRDHFLDEIEKIYRKYEDQVEGIAISMPGNLDSETGFIDTPGMLTFNYHTNIFEGIHSRIPNINVAVQNDGKCAALAELWLGNLSDVKDGAVLVLGSGIGGGLIVNRNLLIGSHFFAGELSFLIENPENFGFEHVFAMNGSTTGLCLKAATLKKMDPTLVNGKLVFEWIKDNDEAALEALDHMTKHIATQIFNIT